MICEQSVESIANKSRWRNEALSKKAGQYRDVEVETRSQKCWNGFGTCIYVGGEIICAMSHGMNL